MHVIHCVSLLLFLCVWIDSPGVEAWSGNVCRRREVYYYSTRMCVYRLWRSCCQWRVIRKAGYRWMSYCCKGWTHNGNRNCNIPICYRCYNGGTCIAPSRCRCRIGYSGDMCAQPLCSWERPCYPGTCGAGTDTCTCSANYGGSYCNTLEKGEEPQLTSTSTTMLERNREDGSILYTITTDATDPDVKTTETFWTSLRFFNFMTVNWETFHENRTDLPPFPEYIADAKFGIVAAYCEIRHMKRNGLNFVEAARLTHNCSNTLSQDNPEEGLANCTVPVYDFFNTLENRDILTITVRAKNGGYRTLLKPNNRRSQEYYKGLWKEKKMQFEFDFVQPEHCKFSSSCDLEPIRIYGGDIRKTAFTMRWSGWEDTQSGVERYIWRLFLLKPDSGGQLTEGANPVPVYQWQANGTDAGDATDTWKPDSPGMYSIYLQVSDKANNSQLARALVFYDPSTSVELNESPSSRLYVSSASPETDYRWQDNLTEPIIVSWTNHFRNKFHEDNKLLNKVLPFSIKDYVYRQGDRAYVSHKAVQNKYDDHAGDRTVNAIPNTHGIVKFEIAYRMDASFATFCTQLSPPSNWKTVPDISEEYIISDTVGRRGYTLCVWVRATDSLGNSNLDVTSVRFDDTAPLIEAGPLQRNVKPYESYQSTLQCDTDDPDSGIKHVEWFLRDDSTGRLFEAGTVDTKRPENETCTALSAVCACAPANTDNCYRKRYNFHIPHCAINVTKAEVAKLVVRVDIEVTNGAGIKKSIRSQRIGNVTGLSGINTYVAPQNFQRMDVGTTSATIKWENPPSCYPLSAIFVSYIPVEGGQFVNRTVYSQKTELSFNALSRGTKYVLWISNVYDTEISDPSEFTFETKSFESREIAGLVTGLLLLLVIGALLIAMFV